MEEAYWRPGNGAAFLDLVHSLTGEPLSADAWVRRLQQSVGSVLQQEEHDYQEAVQEGPKIKPGQCAQSWPPQQYTGPSAPPLAFLEIEGYSSIVLSLRVYACQRHCMHMQCVSAKNRLRGV